MKNKMLSQSVVDNILFMITIGKRFSVGNKLSNELELSEGLNVSRITLREAIRIYQVIFNKYAAEMRQFYKCIKTER